MQMKKVLLEKIKPKGYNKLSIALFGYVTQSESNRKTKIYAAQDRAYSTFHNTKDYKVKIFMKYPSTLLTDSFFNKLKTKNENI